MHTILQRSAPSQTLSHCQRCGKLARPRKAVNFSSCRQAANLFMANSLAPCQHQACSHKTGWGGESEKGRLQSCILAHSITRASKGYSLPGRAIWGNCSESRLKREMYSTTSLSPAWKAVLQNSRGSIPLCRAEHKVQE